MNIRGFVKRECANWTNGGCLGVKYEYCGETKRTITSRFHKGECLIFKRERCPWFKRALLPLAERQGEAGVVEEYADIAKEIIRTRKIRYCGCGVPLKHRERLCERCRNQKRRESYRSYKARQRKSAVHS